MRLPVRVLRRRGASLGLVAAVEDAPRGKMPGRMDAVLSKAPIMLVLRLTNDRDAPLVGGRSACSEKVRTPVASAPIPKNDDAAVNSGSGGSVPSAAVTESPSGLRIRSVFCRRTEMLPTRDIALFRTKAKLAIYFSIL